MRSDLDVYSSLISWALESGNVRAIVINGSRGDPSRQPDELSDYDVAVVVRDLTPIRDGGWIARFGEVIVRWPLEPQPTLSQSLITQLVLFTDGTRIDFQFATPDVEDLEQSGPFHCVLLDRDLLTESIQGTAVQGTRIELPTEHEFDERINAFWWDIPYVAKALRRGEIDYARYVMEADLRFNKLHPLLRWHIASVHGSDTDVGIFGRWFTRYLEPELLEQYRETFSGADTDEQWQAMFAMTALVRRLGTELATATGYDYPSSTDSRVSEFLRDLYERS